MSLRLTYTLSDIKDLNALDTLLRDIASVIPSAASSDRLLARLEETNDSTTIEEISAGLLAIADCLIVPNRAHPAWVGQNSQPPGSHPSLIKLAAPPRFPSVEWRLATEKERSLRLRNYELEVVNAQTLLARIPPEGEWPAKPEWPTDVEDSVRDVCKNLKQVRHLSSDIRVFLKSAEQDLKNAKGDPDKRLAALKHLRQTAASASQAVTEQGFTVEMGSATDPRWNTFCYTIGQTRTPREMLDLAADIMTDCGSKKLESDLCELRRRIDESEQLVNGITARAESMAHKITRISVEILKGGIDATRMGKLTRARDAVQKTQDEAIKLVDTYITVTPTHKQWVRQRAGVRLKEYDASHARPATALLVEGVVVLHPPSTFPAEGWTSATNAQRSLRLWGHEDSITKLNSALRAGRLPTSSLHDRQSLFDQTRHFLGDIQGQSNAKPHLSTIKLLQQEVSNAFLKCSEKYRDGKLTQDSSKHAEYRHLVEAVTRMLSTYSQFVFTVGVQDGIPGPTLPSSAPDTRDEPAHKNA